MVLVGITHTDTPADADWLAAKIAGLRIFDDSAGVMNLDLNTVSGAALVVSQFTLHASTKKGNRPSYMQAAPPDIAIPLYEYFLEAFQAVVAQPLVTGVFGAHMDLDFVNSGPVTIIIDTKDKN
jgi:D-tyrosyl-tRNA(Tyr) deacylase